MVLKVVGVAWVMTQATAQKVKWSHYSGKIYFFKSLSNSVTDIVSFI